MSPRQHLRPFSKIWLEEPLGAEQWKTRGRRKGGGRLANCSASRARSLKSSCQNRADRFRSSNEFMMIAEGVVLGHKGRTPDDPRKDGMLVEWCEVRLAFIEATIGGGLPNGACPIVSGDPERAGVASIYRLT
ncbi:MAG: hypothetical protein AUG46_09625 [Acidobacteria bacterium 13_1_20CM_3_58_11]|nr:MAG: hypothetical protein AUG46_09625 [Acidobacteria bacterium 13_1_20CM_3_58_11]